MEKPLKERKELFLRNSDKVWGQGLWEYYMDSYININTEMNIKCLTHNKWFKQSPAYHLDGIYGGDCCRKSNAEIKFQKSTLSFIKRFTPYKNKFVPHLDTFIGINPKMRFTCIAHNHVFYQSPKNLLKGHPGCLYCVRKNALDLFLKKAITSPRRFGYFFDVESYINLCKKMTVFCITHKHVFYQSPKNFLKGEVCCELCKLEKIKETFVKNSEKMHKGVYIPQMGTYTTSSRKMSIWCTIHKKMYTQIANNHVRGCICPDCSREERIGTYAQFIVEKYKKSQVKTKGRCYIIRCWNDEEEFYKIGITRRTVHLRFSGIQAMPYNYETIYEYPSNIYNSFYIEQHLHKVFKDKQYIPKIYFAGKNECFSELPLTLDEIKVIIKQVETSIENNTHRDSLQEEEHKIK